MDWKSWIILLGCFCIHFADIITEAINFDIKIEIENLQFSEEVFVKVKSEVTCVIFMFDSVYTG